MKASKDFLYPGRCQARNLRGEVVEQDFSPERVRRLTARMQEMIDAGLPVPLAWEHQPSAVPMSLEAIEQRLADKARLIFGHVGKSQLHPMGFGEAELEVRRPEDVEQLAAVRFVSPLIDVDYTDPTGRLWPGESILHLAATGRPVQFQQQPVQLSQTAICLSLDGYGSANMADEPKPDESGAAGIKAIIEALRETGMNIPDEVADADGLVIAIKASKEPPPEEPAPIGTETPLPAPVAMSQEAASARIAALESKLLRKDYDSTKAEIVALCDSGRLSPAEESAWLKRLGGGIQLSQEGATGTVPADLAADVKAHKKLPEKSVWAGRNAKPATAPKKEREVPRPGDEDEEAAQADKDADDFAERRNKRQRA